ncbi:MAG: hypothetical protein GY835_04550 [bacterium]|nr:hypothetical protein [bacterium]
MKCGGACCKYIATEIDEPVTFADFENIRWYCTHKDTWVFKDDDSWHVVFNGPCEFLNADGSCGNYDDRPQVCRDHQFGECDYYLNGEFDLELHTLEDVDNYLRLRFPNHFRKKRLEAKRKSKVRADSDASET